MKLEIEKEEKIENGGLCTWYKVTVDGIYVTGSSDLEKIEKVFEEIKANPNLLKTSKEILKSEEI